jgi:hypothetical protein
MHISDVENMGEIAQNLIAKCAAREDKLHDLQLATFAVFQLRRCSRNSNLIITRLGTAKLI